MSLVKWGFIGLIALPAAEILAFLLVAGLIGWFPAVVALVAISAWGIILLRRSGRRDLDRFIEALRTEGLAALHLGSPGAASMLGAVLLVVPGFITGALGGALVLPGLRRWATAALAKIANQMTLDRRQRRPDHVIDLEPGEWHHVPDKKSARRRKRERETRVE